MSNDFWMPEANDGGQAAPASSPFPAPAPTPTRASLRDSRPTKRRRKRSLGARIAGVIGELLITAGVLVGLFVVWQWFWTDMVAHREQAEMMNALPWTPPPAVAAPLSLERRDDPPIEPVPEEGTIFGQLYIPRFGSEWVSPLAHGTSRRYVLDRLGVGHFPDSQMPGELGNFATAGHRTSFGSAFRGIADLEDGDPIVVRTETTWYVYRVTGRTIIMPDETWVIAPVPDPEMVPGAVLPELTRRIMTLTSCHPIGSTRERYIVWADFDFWMPVSDGIPQLLIDAGVRIVGVTEGAI